MKWARAEVFGYPDQRADVRSIAHPGNDVNQVLTVIPRRGQLLSGPGGGAGQWYRSGSGQGKGSGRTERNPKLSGNESSAAELDLLESGLSDIILRRTGRSFKSKRALRSTCRFIPSERLEIKAEGVWSRLGSSKDRKNCTRLSYNDANMMPKRCLF